MRSVFGVFLVTGVKANVVFSVSPLGSEDGNSTTSLHKIRGRHPTTISFDSSFDPEIRITYNYFCRGMSVVVTPLTQDRDGSSLLRQKGMCISITVSSGSSLTLSSWDGWGGFTTVISRPCSVRVERVSPIIVVSGKSLTLEGGVRSSLLPLGVGNPTIISGSPL